MELEPAKALDDPTKCLWCDFWTRSGAAFEDILQHAEVSTGALNLASAMASAPYQLHQCSSISSVEHKTRLLPTLNVNSVLYQGISCVCSLSMLARAQFSTRQPLHQILSGLGRLVGLEVQTCLLSGLDEDHRESQRTPHLGILKLPARWEPRT